MRTFTTLFLLVLLVSCQKEIITPNAQIRTPDKVERSLPPPPYDSNDLLGLLSEYGTSDLDIVPTWNNFFQGASCGNAVWNYTGLGTSTFIINGEEIQTQSLVFQTYQPTGAPLCDGYEPQCNGGLDCIVRVEYNGAIYERSAIGWAQRIGVPFPNCEIAVFEVEPSGTFWQGQPLEFEPYQFIIQSSLSWDLNGDNTVNGEDLQLLLANYGN